MTVKYHLSVNGPNRELLGVQAEGDGDDIYSQFRAAIADVGLEQIYAQLAGEDVVQQAQAALAATFPGAAPVTPAPYAQPIQQQPAYQQPAPGQFGGGAPAAAPGAPVCPHGPMTRRTGTNARGAWTGYFCPSPKGTPDQCKARFE